MAYTRKPLFRRIAGALWRGVLAGAPGSSATVPVTAIMTEGSDPVLTEGAGYLLTES